LVYREEVVLGVEKYTVHIVAALRLPTELHVDSDIQYVAEPPTQLKRSLELAACFAD
jgi:hypothetical protein